jgi:uncharacterized protein YqhQ
VDFQTLHISRFFTHKTNIPPIPHLKMPDNISRDTSPSNSQESFAVGGQAVIEGVMMRSSDTIATAVRNPQGEIVLNSFHYVPISKRSKFWGLPIIRGAVNLGEALYFGIKTLNWSAEIALPEGKKKSKKEVRFWEKMFSSFSFLGAIIIALVIFMFIPYWASGMVREAGGSQFLFHMLAGVIRIALFLLYLCSISFWSEIRRVFQYHGAEHKSIFAFEAGGEEALNSAARHSRFHPRCGTSFLLITAIVIIFLFAILDSIIVPLFGEYKNPLQRLLVHLPFIPLVAGVAYEVLKLSDKKKKTKFWNGLIQPGLWLQHITTQEPDASQLEVAIAALKAALKNNKPYTAN